MQVTLAIPTVSEFVNWCQQRNLGEFSNGFVLYMVIAYSSMTVALTIARLRHVQRQPGDFWTAADFWLWAISAWLLSPFLCIGLIPYFLISGLSAPFIWWRKRSNG